MSATSNPYGLRAVRSRNGGTPRTHALVGGIASAYGTAIFIGDPVKLVTGGVLELAAEGDSISGVFAGLTWDDANVFRRNYWIAGATYTKKPTVHFYEPDVLFAIQGAGSIAQTAIGDAADIVIGSGNARSGLSTSYLKSGSLVGNGNSAQAKIWDLHRAVGNAWGDTYTEVLVMLNELNLGHQAGNAI